MPYAGRPAIPPLNLEELARRRQQHAMEEAPSGPPPVPPRRVTRPVSPSPQTSELPYRMDASSLDRWMAESAQQMRVASPPVPRAFEHLDVPRSVSPGRTPQASPRSTHVGQTDVPPMGGEHVASVSTPRALIFSPALSATLPGVQTESPDAVALDLQRGRNALRLLREQDLRDYETHDKQQETDGHEVQKLMAALRSWSRECELQSHRVPARRGAFAGSTQQGAELAQLDSANEYRLKQLKFALTRSDGQSPQYEIRNPLSPPLSRQSSSSSRHGSMFRFSPIRKANEVASARSSISNESLFSRDSISSLASASYGSGASSAASAMAVGPAEPVLSPSMLTPLVKDLDSILSNEWNLDQCLTNVSSMFVRLEVLDLWIYGLRLRRRRAAQGPQGLHGVGEESPLFDEDQD